MKLIPGFSEEPHPCVRNDQLLWFKNEWSQNYFGMYFN